MAASLAASGMTGPSGILDGPLGVMQVFAGKVGHLAEQTATLGQMWHLPDAAYKLYPCCHYIHPFLEATEKLMAQGLRAEQVKSITVDVAAEQVPLICEPWARRQAPSSGYDGKWGLAYCIALMLQTGKVDVASFETAPDPAVIALAQQIDWRVMDNANFPQVFPAHVAVETTWDASLSATIEDVCGTSKRPVNTNLIEAKFMQNAQRHLPVGACHALLDMLKNISDASDLSALSAILRLPSKAKPLAFSHVT
jgi:2-methylcitrate dehydratase PrpD